MSAAFMVAYGMRLGSPSLPETDEIFTIFPLFCPTK